MIAADHPEVQRLAAALQRGEAKIARMLADGRPTEARTIEQAWIELLARYEAEYEKRATGGQDA